MRPGRLVLLAALLLLVAASPARADAGRSGCAGLPASELEEAGERAMARMLGDDDLHEQIDALMERRHGEEGARAMHRTLGAHLVGCGGPGTLLGPGMGMGAMAGPPGMRSGDPEVLARLAADAADDDDETAAAIAAAAMVLLPLLALGGVLLARRRRPAATDGDDALSLLERRLASGDIDPDDFDARLKALKGDT